MCKWDEDCGDPNRKKCDRGRFKNEHLGRCVECVGHRDCVDGKICAENRTCIPGQPGTCVFCEDQGRTCLQPTLSVPPDFEGCPFRLTPVLDVNRTFFHMPMSTDGLEMQWTCADDWKFVYSKLVKPNTFFDRPLCAGCCSCMDLERQCMHKVFESPVLQEECDNSCLGFGDGSQKYLFSVPDKGTCASEWPWSAGRFTSWKQCLDVENTLARDFVTNYDEKKLQYLMAKLLQTPALKSWSCASVEGLVDKVKERMGESSFLTFTPLALKVLGKPPTYKQDPSTRPLFKRVYDFFHGRITSPGSSQCTKGPQPSHGESKASGGSHAGSKASEGTRSSAQKPSNHQQPSQPQQLAKQLDAAKALADDFIGKMKQTDWSDSKNAAVPEALHAMMAEATGKAFNDYDIECMLSTLMTQFRTSFQAKASKFKIMYIRHLMYSLHPDKSGSKEGDAIHQAYVWAFQGVQCFDMKFVRKDLTDPRCSCRT